MSEPAIYRIKPRYALMAAAAAAVGVALLVIGAVASSGTGRIFAIACGVAGLVLGALYLMSPVRQLDIAVSDDAIAVRRRGDTRLAIDWSAIETVLISERGLYLWTGDPARSLLVPGPGIPGPYAVEDRAGLMKAIERRAPGDAIERVDDLLLAYRELVAAADPDADPAAEEE